MFKDLVTGIIDLVYPALCILCKTPLGPLEKTHQLCFACQGRTVLNRPPFCRKCSRPLENPAHHFCRNCQNNQLHFDRAWGVFLYNRTFQRLIHLFKYGSKTGLRHFFTDRMSGFLETYHIDLSRTEVIVPVPLHPTRKRERGYNQAEIIARMLSETIQAPVSSQNLIRTRHTPNQARLSQKDRWTNLEAAFKIKNPNEFHNKSVLVIDDLYTTGATSSQAAKVLKNAGALSVNVLTLAVAVPDRKDLI